MKYLIKFYTIIIVCIIFSFDLYAEEKIKIGLVVPLTGENKELGETVLNSVRLAINDINDDNIEIVPNSKKLDWEVELGIIIGKDAKHISQEDSRSHILGYCLVNDLSEREWQIEKMGQWVKGKSHDTYGPIGPYLVTKDEIKDVNNLNMSLDLNGSRMQTGNTNTMVFNVDVIVSYVSKFMSLQPGDIITTGTPPGVGMGMKPQKFLKAEDELKLTIDNLGEQKSKLVAI